MGVWGEKFSESDSYGDAMDDYAKLIGRQFVESFDEWEETEDSESLVLTVRPVLIGVVKMFEVAELVPSDDFLSSAFKALERSESMLQEVLSEDYGAEDLFLEVASRELLEARQWIEGWRKTKLS